MKGFDGNEITPIRMVAIIVGSVILALVFFDLLRGCEARADDRKWTREDTVRQGVFFALELADWAQTRGIAKNPDRYCERVNPILGEHPSVRRVDAVFAVGIAAHTAVAVLLPRGWREAFQYVSIGVEAGMVTVNFSIGLSLQDGF